MASPLVLYRKNTLTSSPEITESGIDDQTKQPQNFYLKLASSFIKNTFDSQGSPLKSNIKKLTIVQEAGEDANLKDDVLKASPVIHPQKIPTLEEMPQSDPTISNFGYNKTQAQPESQVREEDLCVICFSNPQNSVNMPCGHGSLCIECSLDVLKKSDDCCICRELVEQVLELDVDGSHKRNDCWRVKKCYVFFEEGSSYDSDGEESDNSQQNQENSNINPYIGNSAQVVALTEQQSPVRDEESPPS